MELLSPFQRKLRQSKLRRENADRLYIILARIRFGAEEWIIEFNAALERIKSGTAVTRHL